MWRAWCHVQDRVVNVLTWYCHQSLREVWIGRRFPTQPGCTDCLTTTAVHDIISQCFLLETLAIVGIDLCEEDFVMFAPHCLKLTTLRFERVVCLLLTQFAQFACTDRRVPNPSVVARAQR